MDATRHLVALVCLAVSCVFVLVAIATGRPFGSVLVGTLAVAACAVAAWRTRPGTGRA